MINYKEIKNQFSHSGFAIVDDVFGQEEIDALLGTIAAADAQGASFRRSADLFAIRRFLKEVPGATDIVFNEKLNVLIQNIFGEGYFVIKSIYFDKPEKSNWFVAYHQDLTIAVAEKTEQEGYSKWTKKDDAYAVQPPLQVLQDNVTIRIHLDKTDAANGALKVIPGSHNKGIYRPETIDWSRETEAICEVLKGGIMLMKPLLLHASGRTTNNEKRRVVHIEFSRMQLPGGLEWAEGEGK